MRHHALAIAVGGSVLLLCPRLAAACSLASGVDGVEYFDAIQRHVALMGATSVACASLWALIGNRRPAFGGWMVVLAVPALLHPAWWMAVQMGDCGMWRHFAAIVVASTSVVLLGVAFFFTRSRDSR